MTVRFITCAKCFHIDHVQGFIQCPKCGVELCKQCTSGPLTSQECALQNPDCSFGIERLNRLNPQPTEPPKRHWLGRLFRKK